MTFIYAFNWINELRQLCIKTSWSTLIQNLFLRGPELVISWIPRFWSNPSDFRMRFWSECCLIVDLYQRQQKSKWKQKKLEKKIKNSLKLVSGQTSVRSNQPLIRQVPDHCPDKRALEAFSRPCNSSAPGPCVCLKLVWSGVTSVWPPRPGYSNSPQILHLLAIFSGDTSTRVDQNNALIFQNFR